MSCGGGKPNESKYIALSLMSDSKATQCVPEPVESSKFIMYIPSSFVIISLDVTCICIFNFFANLY